MTEDEREKLGMDFLQGMTAGFHNHLKGDCTEEEAEEYAEMIRSLPPLVII